MQKILPIITDKLIILIVIIRFFLLSDFDNRPDNKIPNKRLQNPKPNDSINGCNVILIFIPTIIL